MTTEKITNAQEQTVDGSFLESVDHFLDELTQMSTRQTDRRAFYEHLVQRLQNITDCLHAVIWVEGPNQVCLPAVSAIHIDLVDKPAPSEFRLTYDDLIRISKQEKTVCLENRGSKTFSYPIGDKSRERKLIALVFENPIPSQMNLVYGDLIAAVGDIATDFERNLTVDRQQQQFAKLESFVQLINNSHSSLEPQRVAYHLTNDIRSFLGVDRVWLFSAPHVKLLSCSGVSDVNPRTRTFKQLARVARDAIRRRQSYSYLRNEQASHASPNRQLQTYLETSPCEGIYLTLLRQKNTQQIMGVLVVEIFHDHDKMSLISGLNNIVPCVESALANSLTHARIPFRRGLSGLRWVADRFRLNQLPRTVLILGLIAGLAWLLFAVKTDFTIDVDGELRPAVERHIFSPTDGLVESVLADYGDAVNKDQAVAQMVSQQFELRLKQLQGELNAARKKLEANQVLRTQANQDGRDAIYLGQLTAEIEQNRLSIEAVNKNIELYLDLTEDLKIKSPISGHVISRDVQLSLLNRPVTAGNRLLTIADTSADWNVVFQVPDREFGYLLKAKSSGTDEWPVAYRLKSDLDSTIDARIKKVDDHNNFDEDGNSYVHVFVPVDKTQINDLRVGQTVRGKIYCGKKSLFFIWTRDIRDFLRANFFWT